jgi:hypothetical protein
MGSVSYMAGAQGLRIETGGIDFGTESKGIFDRSWANKWGIPNWRQFKFLRRAAKSEEQLFPKKSYRKVFPFKALQNTIYEKNFFSILLIIKFSVSIMACTINGWLIFTLAWGCE